mmetsp:Transcript_41640/g.96284  ORF Transcript_41640/g.96284 Transcript_41640/m.96284 type:complete len:457 (-) Transcript_41640:305-1675(-)|eukprot:CAMPEP_0182561170 /NCGR_PEP_ID=MMETSP1324-20130603/3699_1 /TAXON_ID=236786 /ORGANISM="Florenciella sp., Strain RCC1587" /LENGTH=456 /DNA_ID=CAMNT_0024773715 /DNA_START=143 /DNA_END=1513 /DNA_ORIENTATION=-
MGIKRMPRVSSSSRLSSEHGRSSGMGGLRRGLTEPTSLNLLDGGSADPIRDCIRTLTPSTSLSQLHNLTATVVRRAGHGPGSHRTAEKHAHAYAYDTPGPQGYQGYQHDEAAVLHRAALARKAFLRHNMARNNSSLTRLNELAAPVAQSVAKGVRTVQRLGRGRKDFFKNELRGFLGARLVIFFPIFLMMLYVSCSVAAVAVPFFVGGLRGLYPSGGLVGRLGLGFGGPVRPAVTYEYGKNPLVLAMTSSASKLEGLKLHNGHGGKGKVKDADMDATLFLDAVEEVKPVYESLGFMFSIASREVTNNVDKLRKHVQDYSRTYPERRPPSLHDLVVTDIGAGRQWHKDGSFEALRWLGFGLKFMETVFTCVGEGESDPSVCAQLAYDRALKPVHGPALQHLSKSLLRIVPVSPGMIIEKLEVDDEQARAYMVRWGRAILRPRAAIEEWYMQWPPPKA